MLISPTIVSGLSVDVRDQRGGFPARVKVGVGETWTAAEEAAA